MPSPEIYTKGVSIVICCYNSRHKIPETLRHLQNQAVSETVPWEVVIVDNASNDETANTCRSIWDTAPVTQMRIVREEQLGLVYARLKGFQEARYEFVSFVDDDNWVASDWVATVHDVMGKNPDIGAVGGLNSPVFEGEAPDWFPQFEKSYAVGRQSSSVGDISGEYGVLCGAGLSIRKPAWDQLLNNGFSFTLVGRQGDQLLCGEDYELCLAIRLAGWKIWYEPTLKLEHFMPANRLNWRHLRRMIRGYGATKTRLAAYGYGDVRLYQKGAAPWWKVALRISKSFLKHPVKAVFSQLLPYEGDKLVTNLDIKFGEFLEILTLRQSYTKYFQTVKQAPWNVIGHSGK